MDEGLEIVADGATVTSRTNVSTGAGVCSSGETGGVVGLQSPSSIRKENKNKRRSIMSRFVWLIVTDCGYRPKWIGDASPYHDRCWRSE